MGDRMAATKGAKTRRKVFYGWWIVAVGGVLNAIAGGTYWNGFSVYFLPVTRDLGLSRTATSFAYGMARLEGGLEGPAAGYLVDRLGPRTIIAFGGVMAGLGFILLSLTHSFTMFLVVYIGVLSLGMNGGFNHGVMAAVNQWFIRRKGMAMSIVSLGQSIGGAVVVPAVAAVVLTIGWRSAAVISGLVILVVVVPLSFVVRSSPESVGLLPDGDQAPAITQRGLSGTKPLRFGRHITTVDFTAKEAFRTRTYWLLAMAMGLRIAAHSGVFVHLVPLMVWRGQSEATGAFVVAFVSMISIPLRILLGWVGDKWAKQKVVGITMILSATSLVILLVSEGALWQLLVFASFFAFAEGVSGMSWSLVGDFFGRRSFATLRGGITMVYSLLSMGTPVFAGWVFDTTDSYYYALIPIVGIYLMSALLFWNLPRPRLPSRVEAPTTGDASTG
jgi:sugar phosphate permease